MTVTLAPAAEVDARLAFATRIAEAGGRRLLAVRGSGRWTDPDMLGDVGDQAADGYLQGALQARWPDDGILSEETVDAPERLQRAWTWIVGQAGRPIRTDLMAKELSVTREHLSRSFATAGAPNLKRIIDLVRVIAAAELSKCPGYDAADVARVLAFASPSHLATTAQRVCGTRSASLARLRTGDIIERFLQGRGRSRR